MSSDLAPSTLRTRSSLIFQLRDWDNKKGWEEFYGLYRKLVYGYGRRLGLTHEESEEVTNDVFVRVSQTIHEFESNPNKGSFRGWLMNLTRWKVTDKLRSRPRAAEAHRPEGRSDETGTVERLADPSNDDAIWDKEWQTNILDAAMERLSHKVQAKHFQIFELHSRRNWTVMRLASEFGVNAGAVYLITHRLTKQLRQEVASLKATLD